jgi:hypothetical protein
MNFSLVWYLGSLFAQTSFAIANQHSVMDTVGWGDIA